METSIIICCIVGGVIGLGLGIFWDYWDKREYYRMLRRNKKELNK